MEESLLPAQFQILHLKSDFLQKELDMLDAKILLQEKKWDAARDRHVYSMHRHDVLNQERHELGVQMDELLRSS